MPTTLPGPDRLRLGFTKAVEESFDFLRRDFGYRMVEARPTFVRFESSDAFVNVFHGRSSYELGVEIGRWLEIDDETVEQKFSLGEVIALDHDPSRVGYRPFATTEREPLGRFVRQLGDWTRRFATQLLEGDRRAFDRLSYLRASNFQASQEGRRAAKLRVAATEAWRRKDWGRVVDAYEEIVSELRTVKLEPSELGRLRYAQRKLESGR